MGKFHDLTDSLGYGEDGVSLAYPETFIDDARSAYDADMSIPAARVSVLESDLAAAQQEIMMLKAHNYELITQVPSDEPETPGDDNAADENDEPEDEGTDSLFGSNDDKENK